MVLYRKYRPQTIGDLDCESVRTRLHTLLSSAYIPHAFLFSGSKGAGKTSAARILAKIFNCETLNQKSEIRNSGKKFQKEPTTHNVQPITHVEPCNVCETCKAISEGRYMDVMEIDAASNRGIDDIRTLRENIKLSPIAGSMKVYVIDEVHMLTNEAFNALLKTLEEPPPHAVFIMATTEPEKVPETIRSRATTIHFPQASRKEIIHALQRVITGEGVSVDSGVLDQIADSADGSFRDATKLLEQVLAEGALTAKDAGVILGGHGVDSDAFLLAFGQKDAKKLLDMIETMKQSGVDLKGYISRVIDVLHGIFLLRHGVPAAEASFPETVPDKEQVLLLLKLFSRVHTECKTASRPEIPLEIAVVEWCEK